MEAKVSYSFEYNTCQGSVQELHAGDHVGQFVKKKQTSRYHPRPTKSETHETVSCNLHLNELPERLFPTC